MTSFTNNPFLVLTSFMSKKTIVNKNLFAFLIPFYEIFLSYLSHFPRATIKKEQLYFSATQQTNQKELKIIKFEIKYIYLLFVLL